MSNSVRPRRRQPTRLLRPWDSPSKNTGVGCHFLLQCMKVKSEMKSLSRVQLLATPWTAAHQAPPSMGFSRQEYWSHKYMGTRSRKVSLVIPPLCQSSFYLNAFSYQKCLVTFAPTFQTPLTVVCLTFISCSLNFPK